MIFNVHTQQNNIIESEARMGVVSCGCYVHLKAVHTDSLESIVEK